MAAKAGFTVYYVINQLRGQASNKQLNILIVIPILMGIRCNGGRSGVILSAVELGSERPSSEHLICPWFGAPGDMSQRGRRLRKRQLSAMWHASRGGM